MIDIEKIDWKNYELKIACRGCSESLELNDITEFQGELKKRTQADIDKAITSIYKYGFSFPFFIWVKLDDLGIPEINYCMDGHCRILALRYLRDKKGVSIPSLPVVYIDARDEEEAKQKLLRLNSQYGQMTVESVIEFAGNIELDETELSLPSGVMQIGEEEETDGEELYTKKINAPIYEITGERPTEKELFDDSKHLKLVEEISKANIPEEVKAFLVNASTRHIVFDYHKIAEYYAHASKEVQALMEKSALVIIDFDKAIENGYVELSNEIIAEYKDEYAHEQ